MTASALVLPAYAKLNLWLSVKGLLPDGRHEIATIYQALSLHDLLEIARSDRTTLEVEGDVPAGEENLVLRAAKALEEAAGRSLPARFRLLKRIPAGAGLGGGSSDAATALRGLARLHSIELPLQPLAESLGADVPFFLSGGTAGAEGAGERLHRMPSERAWYGLAWPGFGSETAAVYKHWDVVGGGGRNQLQEAAEAVEPRLREFAARLGTGWVMTGSGSAFFQECSSRAAAEAAVAGLDCWTAVARAVPAWD